MTKAIATLIVVVVLYCGYQFFLYWKKYDNEEDVKKAVSTVVQPENLPGMPYQLEGPLRAAQQQGPAVFRQWLKTYGPSLQDPRKAWIELDFCVAVAREDPSEARRVFAEVKGRVPPNSPVWPRVKELEKTYR